jgi:hypothetical protein
MEPTIESLPFGGSGVGGPAGSNDGNSERGRSADCWGSPPDVVSRWARARGERRSTDPVFAKAIDELDSFLSESERR